MAINFGFGFECISDLFSVSTPVSNSIMARRVHRSCVVSICGIETLVDQIELDILDIDIIMGMDWFYFCYSSLDYRTQTVSF